MAQVEHAIAVVDAMIDRGRPFQEIEEFVEQQTLLTNDQRSGLWLYAYSAQPDFDRAIVVLAATPVHLPV